MKKTIAENFLELLTLNGHSGDTMCLTVIERKLNLGIEVAAKHYTEFLPNATVKKMNAVEVTKAVKNGAKVWTTQGLIVKSKLNVPMLNGVLLLNENIEKLVKTPVIVLE